MRILITFKVRLNFSKYRSSALASKLVSTFLRDVSSRAVRNCSKLQTRLISCDESSRVRLDTTHAPRFFTQLPSSRRGARQLLKVQLPFLVFRLSFFFFPPVARLFLLFSLSLSLSRARARTDDYEYKYIASFPSEKDGNYKRTHSLRARVQKRIRLYFPSNRGREIADDISFDIAVPALFLYFSSRRVVPSPSSHSFPPVSRSPFHSAPRYSTARHGTARHGCSAATPSLLPPENKLFNLY